MELGFEMWIGDAAQIAAMRVRKQKTDRQDAQFLLKLMMEDRFPRVWMSSLEHRDLQQLLWHRHRLVQMRTRVLNQLQAIAMNEGIQRKGGLRSAQGRKRLEQLSLGPWATRRREDLLLLLDQLNKSVDELSAAVQQEAEKRPEARLLMTHPGVGPVMALGVCAHRGIPGALPVWKANRELCWADPGRVLERCSSTAASHQQKSNALFRFLLVEAAQAAARFDPEWRSKFLRLAMRRERRIAKVAMARKLAVSLYWMWRQQRSLQPALEVGSYAG